jgi:hypothetical protein
LFSYEAIVYKLCPADPHRQRLFSKVWHDLSGGADEKKMDEDIAGGAQVCEIEIFLMILIPGRQAVFDVPARARKPIF